MLLLGAAAGAQQAAGGYTGAHALVAAALLVALAARPLLRAALRFEPRA
ncbi:MULTISPECIES: hypothetical protein [Nonomuraea]|jgi:hypothetical protein|uniref:MFS transporter n=1 Tax=Nonomuraea salmonea TaxID=46181 RepID=A0ABV5P1C3_9ACTN